MTINSISQFGVHAITGAFEIHRESRTNECGFVLIIIVLPNDFLKVWIFAPARRKSRLYSSKKPLLTLQSSDATLSNQRARESHSLWLMFIVPQASATKFIALLIPRSFDTSIES